MHTHTVRAPRIAHAHTHTLADKLSAPRASCETAPSPPPKSLKSITEAGERGGGPEPGERRLCGAPPPPALAAGPPLPALAAAPPPRTWHRRTAPPRPPPACVPAIHTTSRARLSFAQARQGCG
eukprot:1469538-Rhodomonas_salina.2